MLDRIKNRFRNSLRACGLQAMLALTLALTLGTAAVVPVPAQAAMTISTASRSTMATALLGDIAGGTIELWNGSKPAALGAPSGTLLATLTLGSPAGTVTNGVITIGSVTQTAGSHVGGTPTFIRFKSNGGLVRIDIDVGAGAGNVQFTGAVVTGQVVTVTGLTITMPNA